MKQDAALDFVKTKLEENEGISSASLDRILAAAGRTPESAARRLSARTRRRTLGPVLLAAALSVMACGWLFHADTVDSRRANELANVIDLLYEADGEAPAASDSLPDRLLAWQDAPTLADDAE